MKNKINTYENHSIEPKFLNVNGNKLTYILDENLENLKEKAELSFKNNKNIDSVMGMIDLGGEKYSFYVIERDGSLSEFCGNGAIGALKFVKNNIDEDIDSISLITNSGVESEILYKDGKYFVEMEVFDSSNIEEIKNKGFLHNNIKSLDDLKDKLDLKSYLEYFIKNPHDLNDIFPDDNKKLSNYDTYFANLLNKLSKNENFLNFVNLFKIKDIGTASGEPHLIIEIPTIENEFLKNYFLKGFSFLIRNGWLEGENIFPNNINIMFVENNEKGPKMYSSERGVYNGLDYDQTGACGTGTTIAGNYLLKENHQDEIFIENRSSLKLGVRKDGKKVFLVGNEENISSYSENTDKNNKALFQAEAIEEDIIYAINKGKIDFVKEENLNI